MMKADFPATIFAWIVTLAIIALFVFVVIKFAVLPLINFQRMSRQYIQERAKVERICLDNGYPDLIGISQGNTTPYDFEDVIWYCSKRSDRQDVVVPVDSLR